jgi:hypothetical protein
MSNCLAISTTFFGHFRTISLFSAALKPGTVFSSFAMKVLDGFFFQYSPVSSTLKI